MSAEPPIVGDLALMLHAHLPFVRHPEHAVMLEENWLFEALTECYLPLLDMLDRFAAEDVAARFSMTVTPTLCAMLNDTLLQERYAARLAGLVELAEKELGARRNDPEFYPAALHYHERLQRMQTLYEERCLRDIVGAYARHQDEGRLEILASAATHPILPLLKTDAGRRLQILAGVQDYTRFFGRPPRGFWLPECAYAPGLETLLAEAGIAYFLLDAHGLLFGTPRPRCATYAPAACFNGVAAFGRDLESGRQVWSSDTGYPGDPDYREFYRDLGFDAPLDYVRDYLHPDGLRHDLGFKYHRVTGDVSLGEKESYHPQRAHRRATEHAADFYSKLCAQGQRYGAGMRARAILPAPYDAELFGHWWYEGPVFLDALLRRCAESKSRIRSRTLWDCLAEQDELETIQPSCSSWGYEGYFQAWINGSNDWIYAPLHRNELHLIELAREHASASGPVRQALDQAARELLLAQSSDWAFILTTGTVGDYATMRVNTHLAACRALLESVESGKPDPAYLEKRRARINLFPGLDAVSLLQERANRT